MNNTADNFEDQDFTQEFGVEYEYWVELFNEFPESIISDEQYERNKDLLEQISDDFSHMHNISGNFPAKKAKKILEIIFSNIQKFGYR